MMVSARAQDLEDTLSDVDASPKDLVEGGSKTGGGKVELEKTFEFGPSLITEADLKEYVKLGWFNEGRARPSGGESVPRPEFGEAVVFHDFFVCGLCMPPFKFMKDVLEAFSVQLHHLTPNGILALAMF